MSLREKLEDLMVAISFAEAGEFETAKETPNKEKHSEKVYRVPASRKVVLGHRDLRVSKIGTNRYLLAPLGY